MQVSFGDIHLGHSFEAAWMGQSWVQLMVNRCGQSLKMSHRLFIRFVEQMVEHHENHAIPIMVTPEAMNQAMPSDQQVPIVSKAKAKSKALAKAKAGPMLLIPTHVPDVNEEWELNTTMYQPGSMENPLTNPDPNVAAM